MGVVDIVQMHTMKRKEMYRLPVLAAILCMIMGAMYVMAPTLAMHAERMGNAWDFVCIMVGVAGKALLSAVYQMEDNVILDLLRMDGVIQVPIHVPLAMTDAS